MIRGCLLFLVAAEGRSKLSAFHFLSRKNLCGTRRSADCAVILIRAYSRHPRFLSFRFWGLAKRYGPGGASPRTTDNGQLATQKKPRRDKGPLCCSSSTLPRRLGVKQRVLARE